MTLVSNPDFTRRYSAHRVPALSAAPGPPLSDHLSPR